MKSRFGWKDLRTRKVTKKVIGRRNGEDGEFKMELRRNKRCRVGREKIVKTCLFLFYSERETRDEYSEESI